MTEKEKCAQGLWYDANYDKELQDLRNECKDLCYKLNHTLPSDIKAQENIVRELLGNIGSGFVITPPFWCDYGKNIEIGNDFYSNHNLTILDAAKVKIGSNVFIAPNCCISTAGHPLDYERRNQGLEIAKPIIIGNHVWIGANVTILPGVTIGDRAIIGAGSVVTKDIPEDCVAVGIPCKVMREFHEGNSIIA